jgi:hypothetical protein
MTFVANLIKFRLFWFAGDCTCMVVQSWLLVFRHSMIALVLLACLNDMYIGPAVRLLVCVWGWFLLDVVLGRGAQRCFSMSRWQST